MEYFYYKKIAIVIMLMILISISIQWAQTVVELQRISKYDSKYVIYFRSPLNSIAVVDVFTNNVSENPISKYLFGMFLEHHGERVRAGCIYHGIWAEILDNPGFESARYFGIAVRGVETRAYWWSPYGSGNIAYSLVDGYGIGQAQRMEIISLESERVGIMQRIFIPIHRINEYVGYIWIRGSVPKVIITLEKRDGTILYRYIIENVTEEWSKYHFNLTVPEKSVTPCEEIVFAITVDSPGWLELDHASLMPADNIYGFDPDVIRLLREAGVTLIRWPGGNFASQYHWADGIGPMEYRPIRLNRAWNIPEYNRVGTDEFMIFARLVGAEPLIVINAGWDGTIEEAAAWVEYVNGDVETTWGKRRAENGKPEPYGVIWWELGNELYGSWQIGHMSAPQYAKRYGDLYNSMKAIDPSIKFIANGGLDNAGEDHWSWLQWDHHLLERNIGIVEYLSRHYLIWVDMSEPDYYKAIGWTFAIRERWKEKIAILKKYQDPPPKLAITEAQGARDLEVSTTMIEAMWVAGLYNSAIYSDGFVEIITRSSLMWFGGGLRKSCEVVYPTPAYYTHKIYATQPGKYPVLVRVITPTFESGSRLPEIPAASDVPYVDAVALFNDDKSVLSVILVNYHATNSIKTYINLHNYEIIEPIKIIQLTAPSISARNTWNNPDNVKPVEYTMEATSGTLEIELPRLSVTLLLINGSMKPGIAPDPYKATFTLPATTMTTTEPILQQTTPVITPTITTPVSTTPTPIHVSEITTTPVAIVSPSPSLTPQVSTAPSTPTTTSFTTPIAGEPMIYITIFVVLVAIALVIFALLRRKRK